MEEVKAKVSRIWNNKTQNGKTYWVLSVQTDVGDFERYSCWNYGLIQGVAEQDTITFTYEQKGQYNNLLDITKVEKFETGVGNMTEYHKGNRSEILAKMSAIKSASTLLSTYEGTPQEKMTKTLETAQAFIDYMFSPVASSGKPESSPENGNSKSKKKNKRETPSRQTPPAEEEKVF